MNAAQLIEQVRAAGGRIEAKGATLKLAAPKPLSDALLAELRLNKPDLLAYLTAQRHGLTVDDLRAIAGPDWPECERNPALLEALAHAVSTRRMREWGEVPTDYTCKTFCVGCDRWVPVFPGVPDRLLSCPWCFNRAAGKPVPHAPDV
jgi:hypothetical protein